MSKHAKFFRKVLVDQASRPNDLRFNIYIRKYVQSYVLISSDVTLIYINNHLDVKILNVVDAEN